MVAVQERLLCIRLDPDLVLQRRQGMGWGRGGWVNKTRSRKTSSEIDGVTPGIGQQRLTLAYGARYVSAVMCIRNFPDFENLPSRVPMLMRFSRPKLVARFIASSLT